jgi:hypothetical protein
MHNPQVEHLPLGRSSFQRPPPGEARRLRRLDQTDRTLDRQQPAPSRLTLFHGGSGTLPDAAINRGEAPDHRIEMPLEVVDPAVYSL